MKKQLIVLSILSWFALILNPIVPKAEGTENILSMEELSIKVMPEFAFHPKENKKEGFPLLIGYQGTMLNHSTDPQKGLIEIPLPMDKENFRIGYVADYSSDLTKVYEIEYLIDQEKRTISWTTSEEIQPNEVYKFVIEFYTDELKAEKEKRTLSYQFTSFTDIGLFNVTFVEPLKSKKFTLDPAPEEEKAHDVEEGVYSYFFQGMKAGEEKSFTLSYERSETAPTIELLEKQDVNSTEKVKDTTLFSIAAPSSLGLVAVGVFIYLWKRKRNN